MLFFHCSLLFFAHSLLTHTHATNSILTQTLAHGYQAKRTLQKAMMRLGSTESRARKILMRDALKKKTGAGICAHAVELSSLQGAALVILCCDMLCVKKKKFSNSLSLSSSHSSCRSCCRYFMCVACVLCFSHLFVFQRPNCTFNACATA